MTADTGKPPCHGAMRDENGWSMRNQRGQALLIAVLLMTVILLVGAIFVAITIYVQSQTQRHGQMRQSKQMADGGVQYADRMLQLQTADWRPPEPPAWCAGPDGQFDSLDAILDPSYAGDDQFDPGLKGADGTWETDDDYYSVEELERGWCSMRLGDALPQDPAQPTFPDRSAAAQNARGELVRRGFTRYPDPRRGIPAGQDTPAAISNGHVLLRLTYDPDPPFEGVPEEDRNGDGTLDWRDADPLSNMIRIESIGVVIDETFTFRKLVAYKPLALTDYARFITDRSATGQPAYLGIPPLIDLDRDGLDAGLAERYVTRIQGPVKANTELVLVGEELPAPAPADQGSVEIRLLTDGGPGSNSASPYVRRDAVEATAGIQYRDRAAAPNDAQATVTVVGSPGTGSGPIYPTTPQLPGDPPFDTYGALTGDGQAALADGRKGTDDQGYGRFSVALGAPPLFRRDPSTNRTVYEQITRYSGAPVQTSAGYWVNTGEWGHGEGVYINNESDRQFLNARGECDYSTLIDDWMRNLSPTDARSGDSGWNGLQTTYSPVGVEVWLVGEELPASTFAAQADPRSPAIPDTVLWAPSHVAGEPQIVLTRHDRHWVTAAGQDSGRYVMVIDQPCQLRGTWPTNQVILAAGNVRVWGKLPDRGAMPSPGAGMSAAAAPYKDYNLTIVSGGTIYIDGSILAPRDWVSGWAPGADEERNTRLALLARDCVCLNTTRIVSQEATALVSASPDDTDDPRPEASHWELTPEAGARLFGSWQFGDPPTANVYLAAIAAGDDPGPAALGMSCQQGWVSSWIPFDFGQSLGPADARFIFVPPGAGAGVNLSNALTPNYQPLPPRGGSPAVPWNLTPAANPNLYVSTTPGVRNNLQMYWANPGFSAGATNPWVRKWKVVESTSADPTDLSAIVPAVHPKVNATIYAENGCWFVIPGAWFETVEAIDRALGPAEGDNINGLIDTPDEVARAKAYLRYNYDLTVRGSITESFTAPVDAVYEWTDKWSCNTPLSDGSLRSLTYIYDGSVREARDRGGQGATSGNLGAPLLHRSTESANLPRVPLLPVSADLLYFGETM